MNLDFRSCVVGVFVNDEGKVLVGERSDVAGAWQLPQGGIEPGEGALEALYREMGEELGNKNFKVVTSASRLVRYQFPEKLMQDKNNPISQKYCGQTQQWFLLKFKPGEKPDPKSSEEFKRFEWRMPKDVVAGIIEWKRQAYMDGFNMLGFEV